jgi:hypothetical protein
MATDEFDDVDAVADFLDDLVSDPTQKIRLASVRYASHLLERAFASGRCLLLLADTRFVVVLASLQFAQDPGLFALLLEALHGDFERLVIPDLDHGHE